MSVPCKFSIVTPSFNQAAYIGETIESVLSQEGPFEIEYFVMDGGSTDGSVEIIKNYADRVTAGTWPSRCGRITMNWVSQPDKGQSDAINQGLQRSTGTIASYINSDDLFFPGAFARVAEEFDQHSHASFIYGDGDVIAEHGQLQWEWLSRPYNHKVMTSYYFLWNDFTNYIMQQSTFWRTRVHTQIGLFEQTLHYAMDAEYWIRAGAAGLELRHIPVKLGKFRFIQGTKSLSSPMAFWDDQLDIFRRYGPRKQLSLIFAYYFFNLSRQNDFNLTQSHEDGQKMLLKWADLPLEDRNILTAKLEHGYRLACFLTAIELYQKRQDERASTAFRRGVAGRPWLYLHYLALGYLLRRMMGHQKTDKLDLSVQNIISRYRKKFVDYRYHQSR